MLTRLEQVRRMFKWSEKTLAERSDYSVSYIKQLCKGTKPLNELCQQRLADAFGVPFEYLDTPTPPISLDERTHRVICGFKAALLVVLMYIAILLFMYGVVELFIWVF